MPGPQRSPQPPPPSTWPGYPPAVGEELYLSQEIVGPGSAPAHVWSVTVQSLEGPADKKI